MPQITIEDIWERLLSSDTGHIVLTLPNTQSVATVRRALSKYKFLELKRSPTIRDFLGDFELSYEPEALPDSKMIRLHIRRVIPEPNTLTLEGTISDGT